jgi:hypothetical protein
MSNAYKRLTYTKKCIVNLKSGAAFRGYLVEAKKDLIVLKSSEFIEAGSEPVAVSGEVLIEKSNIEFIQVIGG